MRATPTLPRRVSARIGRAAVAVWFLSVGGVGCGGKKEYAPDRYELGAWRFGSVPPDMTVISAGTSTPSTFTTPAVVVPPTPTTPTPSPAEPSRPTPPEPPPKPAPPPTSTSSSSAGYKVVDVKDGGSIHVICRLDKPVDVETVVAFRDQMQGCTDHKSERCRYVKKGDKDLRLGNCLIYLKSIKEGKDWPENLRSEDRIFLIDQKACVYIPHVGWTRPATQVVVTNSDRAAHNIHGNRGSDTTFNFASEPDTRKDSITEAFLEIPDEYIVKCDIHPWMNAFLHVIAHPYVAITPETDSPGAPAGEVVLDNVPPGSYEVVCWHEGMLTTIVMVDGKPSAQNYSPDIPLSKPATVPAGGRVDLEFTVPYK